MIRGQGFGVGGEGCGDWGQGLGLRGEAGVVRGLGTIKWIGLEEVGIVETDCSKGWV